MGHPFQSVFRASARILATASSEPIPACCRAAANPASGDKHGEKIDVIEWNPECPQADEYRKLARAMDTNEMFVIPTPLAIPELESLLLDYGLVAA